MTPQLASGLVNLGIVVLMAAGLFAAVLRLEREDAGHSAGGRSGTEVPKRPTG